MKRLTFLILTAGLLQACSTTSYYVVRHAEKESQTANMSSDVPLSEKGKQRAEALRKELGNKNIKHIYSTNTIRTKSTAEPLSKKIGVPIQVYDHRDTSFVTRVKALPKGNVLIVGHSNTIDDLVNQFYPAAQLSDLPETQFGDVFIIRNTRNKTKLERTHFGGNYWRVKKN